MFEVFHSFTEVCRPIDWTRANDKLHSPSITLFNFIRTNTGRVYISKNRRKENIQKNDFTQITETTFRWILKGSDTQNYWVFGLFPTSGILGNRKHDVSETGSVSIFRCVGGEGKTPTQLGPLGRVNLNHWATPVRFTQLFNHMRIAEII
jgi:hypothetical protein